MDKNERSKPIKVILSASLCVVAAGASVSHERDTPLSAEAAGSTSNSVEAKWQVLKSAYVAGLASIDKTLSEATKDAVNAGDQFRNIAWSNT